MEINIIGAKFYKHFFFVNKIILFILFFWGKIKKNRIYLFSNQKLNHELDDILGKMTGVESYALIVLAVLPSPVQRRTQEHFPSTCTSSHNNNNFSFCCSCCLHRKISLPRHCLQQRQGSVYPTIPIRESLSPLPFFFIYFLFSIFLLFLCSCYINKYGFDRCW